MDQQSGPNQVKKNRVSFKQFQQQYEQQLGLQKEKRKQQQQVLQKLTANNTKPLQNNSKDRGCVVDMSKHKKSLAVSKSKQSLESLSLTELNSLNSSIAFPSNFVSPKASTQTFMKSINLASNKSRQVVRVMADWQSKQKSVDSKLNIDNKLNIPTRQQKAVINLSCGNQKPICGNQKPICGNQKPICGNQKPICGNQKPICGNQKPICGNQKPISSNKNAPHAINIAKDEKQNTRNLKQISSISKMTTTDIGQSSLLSFPSQKMLQFGFNDHTNEDIQVKTHHQTMQYVSYLVSEVSFLNHVFKELQSENVAGSQQQKIYQISYKSKLLAQIRAKLSKESGMFGAKIRQEEGPVKNLHEAIMALMQNYESDLSQGIVNQQHGQTKKPQRMPLSIKINEQPQTKPDIQINHKRHQSKKTIKLSKSRRTHQQTISSQTKAHPHFQTSQFSLMNTSKLTSGSRVSSLNKLTPYMNEIEHVIHSKILDNYEERQRASEQQRPKYDLGGRAKILLRQGREAKEKEMSCGVARDSKKDMVKAGNGGKGFSCDDGKRKTVAKTISLVGGSVGSVDKQWKQAGSKQYPSVPKCTKLATKPANQNTNTINISTETNLKSITLATGKSLNLKVSQQNSPAPSHSHNQSIYQLQFLQNYSGFNPSSNFSSIKPQYSQDLFR